MIKDKSIKGLRIKYDYPPIPPLGIKINVEYVVKEDGSGYKITSGNEEIKLTEREIRTFFKICR